MPISERFVQNAVRDRLNKKYYKRRKVYAGTETYTRLKRADVLLAFMRAHNRPYTVVVEAKSRTTIGNLKLKRNAERQQRYSQAFAMILIVGLLAITGYQYYFNAVNSLLLLLVFLIGSLLISRISGWLDLWFTKSISAIEQLAGYPANESWIAIADDTFVKKSDYNTLKKQCKKNGVGLIVVNEKGHLKLVLKPEARHVFNDYLSAYGKKRVIMQEIGKSNDFGPTPAERNRSRKQMSAFALGLAFVGMTGLLVYEDSYGPVVPDPIAGEDWTFPEIYSEDTVKIAIPLPEPLPGYQECGQLAVTDRSFLVLDLVAKTVSEAGERVQELRKAGIKAEYISANCVRSWVNKKRYLVHGNQLFPDRPTAQAALDEWRASLKAVNVPKGFDRVLKVKPKS